MNESNQLVAFTLDSQQYALHLSAVERVIHAVEITPLPKAPEIVSGVVNVHGDVIPVVDVRKRFRLPERETALSDRIVIAHTAARPVALLVNGVGSGTERSQDEIVAAEKIVPGIEYVEGVCKLEDGLVFIHDLDTFLSLEEGKALDEALESSVEDGA